MASVLEQAARIDKTRQPEPELTTGPIAILGAGNVGQALARGLLGTKCVRAADITLTRRHAEQLANLASAGFGITTDNRAAVGKARQIVVAVQPRQLDDLLAEICGALDPKRHTLISVVTGVSTQQILAQVGRELPVVRAIPNTAIAIGQFQLVQAKLVAVAPTRADGVKSTKITSNG